MDCHRCHGLMVVDHFIDMEDEMGCLWMRGWRCMNCGAVEDPEIYRHRMTQSSLHDRLAKVVAPKGAKKSREVIQLGV